MEPSRDGNHRDRTGSRRRRQAIGLEIMLIRAWLRRRKRKSGSADESPCRDMVHEQLMAAAIRRRRKGKKKERFWPVEMTR